MMEQETQGIPYSFSSEPAVKRDIVEKDSDKKSCAGKSNKEQQCSSKQGISQLNIEKQGTKQPRRKTPAFPADLVGIMRPVSGKVLRERGFHRILAGSTIALFLFGILGQVLCEMMGYTPCLSYYLLHLLPVVGAGVVTYCVAKLLQRKSKACRLLAVILGSIILIWTAFVGYFCVAYQIDEDSRLVYYGDGSYLSIAERSEETRYMISKSRFLGHGDSYYVYSDENDERVQAAVEERDRAEEVFWYFRGETMLPVLSYIYGLWINILFFIIAAAWCLGAVGSFALVQGRGKKILYGVCAAALGIQLASAVLGSFGVIAALIPHPFSLEWDTDLMCVTPQLGIIFALLWNPEKEKEIMRG